MKMLAQKLILSYSTRLSIQFVQVAASIVVARLAGPEVLGTVAFGLAYVSMFSFIADLGFGTAFIKKLSEGNDEALCLGTFSRIKSGLVLTYILFVIFFYLAQKHLFFVSFSDTHIIVIFISLVAVSISQLLMIIKSTFAAYTEQAKSDLPFVLETLIYQISRVIVVLLGFGAVALSLGYLFAVIITVPLYLYYFKNHKIGKYEKELAKDYLKISMPLVLVGITSKLYSDIDKVLLQFFTDSAHVGYYTAGHRIGGFILLLSSSISTLFFPIFSNAAGRKDFNSIKRYVESFERFSFVYIMPLLIIITLFAREIVITLIGKEYSSSIAIMAVVNIAMFVRVTNSPYSSIIVGLGHFNKSMKIGIWNFIVYILLLIILIHPSFFNLAGLGAAVATLVSNIFMLLIYRIVTKKYFPLISNKLLVHYSIYGIFNYCIFFIILNKTAIFHEPLPMVIFLFLYMFFTYLSMYTLKLIGKGDLRYLRILFNLKAMMRYINSEMRGRPS